jgi:hypothetical protein
MVRAVNANRVLKKTRLIKMHAKYCMQTSQSFILGTLRVEKSFGTKEKKQICFKSEESFKLIPLRENVIVTLRVTVFANCLH